MGQDTSDTTSVLSKIQQLFFSYGFKSVTMDDIATQLGISKKTLYQKFPKKALLIRDCCELYFKAQLSTITEIEAANLNAIAELQKIYEHNCSFLQQVHPSVIYDLKKYHPEAWDKFIDFKDKFILQSVFRNLKKGVSEGLYRTDMNMNIIARLYVSRIDMLLDTRIFPREDFTLNQILSELFIYHVRGIATDKGLAQLTKTKLSF